MNEDKLAESLLMFCDALENAVEILKQELKRLGALPGEESFNILKWEQAKSDRLGEFEISHKTSNHGDPWQRAFNILKANNATIKNHYAPEGFAHYYWLYLDKYDDRIFRKKRQQEASS